MLVIVGLMVKTTSALQNRPQSPGNKYGSQWRAVSSAIDLSNHADHLTGLLYVILTKS